MSRLDTLPIRIADRILSTIVPGGRATAIIGDLQERAEQQLAGGRSLRAVTRWYLRDAASLATHYAAERVTGRSFVRHPFRRGIRAEPFRRLAADLRVAVRSLWRRPVFSLVVVATLMLGVGANTAIFTVVRNAVLRPLPFPDPEGLTAMWMEFRREPNAPGMVIVASEPEYLEFTESAKSYVGIAAFWTGRVNLMGGDEPYRVPAAAVSANLFDVLGVLPEQGRAFVPGEDLPGAPLVAMISHGLWERAFGSDPGILGRTVMVDGRPNEIVGVLPATFRFPGEEIDLIRINHIDPSNPAGRSSHYLRLIGRLRPGVSLPEAISEAAVLNERFGKEQAGVHGLDPRHPMMVAGLQERMTALVRPALWVLTAAAGLVLLIACANVANLMYARSEARNRELAIRRAIGAGRARLVGHLLTESLVLGVLGAGAGFGLAYLTVPWLVAAGADYLPAVDGWRPDGTVVAFAAALSVLTALAFGLAPALGSTTRAQLFLREGAGSASRSRTRLRSGLLVTQLAFAVVLLVGAGVLARDLVRLLRVDPGFDPDGVVAMTFSLDVSRYPSQESLTDFHTRLDERLSALPSVIAVGAVRSLPLATDGGLETVSVSGVVLPPGEHFNVMYQVVSPGYFRAMTIPRQEGRLLDATDRADARPVVVINRATADAIWPDGNAIGNTIQLGASDDNPNPEMTVVGIVGNVIHRDLGRAASPQIFTPRAQAGANYGGAGTRAATLVVKGTVPPPALIGRVRDVFRQLDPAIPLSGIRTMDAVVGQSLADERFVGLLLGVFSAVAMSLAAVGVYGLMAYLVVQRTREIGVRIALGAQGGQVVRYVVGRSVALTAAGAGLGLLAALAGSRTLEGFVSMVSVRDPWVFAVGPAVLLVISALAAWAPARRAAGIDPLQAIRAE